KDDALNLLEMDINRIILGTIAMENPEVVPELSNSFGKKKIVVALDSKDSQVVVRGWTEKTDKTAPEMGKFFENMGAGGIICTHVDDERIKEGFSIKLLAELRSAVNSSVVYYGGVSTLEDVNKLSIRRGASVVIGSGPYRGNISCEIALNSQLPSPTV